MAIKKPKRINQIVSFKTVLLKRLLKGMVFISLVTSALCILHLEYNIESIKMSAALPSYMGAALGLLLVFRNNTAYDKWWEARKEMGGLVNITRNFAITINGILPPGNKEKIVISRLIIAFVFALKEHLREGVKMEELTNLEEDDRVEIEKAKHKPNIIVNLIMNKVEKLWESKAISDIQQLILVQQVNTLIDIQGRCERIRNTPIPMAYGFLLKFFIFIYVIILPIGLLDDIGYASIPLVIMLYYILMSIVLTAEEIEEPFGTDLNDLPMDQLSANIKGNIIEIAHLE